MKYLKHDRKNLSKNDHYLMGINLGTTTLKVGIFNMQGKEVAFISKEYGLSYPGENMIENDVEKYWKEITFIIRKVSQGFKKSMIKALSISSQAETITGEMDMKTTNIRFATPAAILTDAALHQLFRYKYGIVFNIEPAYVEAKSPGIQASLLKVFRQMTLGSTTSLPLPIGVLDNASAFSPVQAMIDLEINKGIFGFTRGIEISDKTINTNLINKIGFGETENYLSSSQTLQFFKEILWDSELFDTTYRKNEFYKPDDMTDSYWIGLTKNGRHFYRTIKK